MRWEELFEDLESQAEAAARTEEEQAAAELGVAEEGAVLLADRLRAARGRWVTVGVRDADHAGEVADATRRWVLLADGRRRVLVPLAAVTWVEGVDRVAPDPGTAEARIGLAHPLRSLADAEVTARVVASGRTLVGVISRVGLDHLDVEVTAGSAPVTVPYRAMESVAW